MSDCEGCPALFSGDGFSLECVLNLETPMEICKHAAALKAVVRNPQYQLAAIPPDTKCYTGSGHYVLTIPREKMEGEK
jgi:hypothetical protein